MKGLAVHAHVDTDTPFTPLFPTTSPAPGDGVPLDPEMVEVSLLLPLAQMAALSNAASQCGVSTGQLLRRLIKASLANMNVAR